MSSQNPSDPSRRRALRCMAYGGLGTLFTLSGGVLTPIDLAIAQEKNGQSVDIGKPLFLQISDTHIGFNNEANPDVSGALKQTIDLVKSMPTKPALAIHTGDITRLSKAQEFDLASQLLFELTVPELHTVPGDHDATDDSSAEYFCRFGKVSDNRGYYSFDRDGVHFINRQRHASLHGRGNITFHTARSTAFPQPTAGNGPGPVPLTVARDQSPRMLGVTTVSFAGHPGVAPLHDSATA
ncbi:MULTISPECIES: metallophosphoesterase family protein [Paraburkholderia]|uniref:metallophosphoesterase family protein n=1 Tax=Paraburkholderia TaxID=1822464 RepID=UPI002259CE2A|nr:MULTISPECIES: metallophosphoesterase [Paraburkholderia]MCX4176450.1 metallophosphoesterase [Paraburkholderia madseniana]MDQ6464442.1 metallophosphoesterase [Paraburkholderia madseniana]